MIEPRKELGEKLLKRTPYSVRVRGINVVLEINGRELLIDWFTAIKVAHFLRHASRIAKANMGLGALNGPVVGFADLTDANLDELKAQKSRDGTAVFAKVE